MEKIINHPMNELLNEIRNEQDEINKPEGYKPIKLFISKDMQNGTVSFNFQRGEYSIFSFIFNFEEFGFMVGDMVKALKDINLEQALEYTQRKKNEQEKNEQTT